MRQIREVLRLHHECGRTQREITVAVGLSKGAVSAYLDRAREAGLTWEQARDMTDQDVEARLFRSLGVNEPAARAPVDFAWVHREMRRKGVTLQLLWGEYAEGVRSAGGGARAYQYSQFCEVYASWRQTLSPTMRQTHRAGEKLFLDYSGKRPEIVDPATGEVRAVELFVAVMGASSFTFAEATLTQRLPDFIGSVVRALEFLAAVPEVLVPDQLRSAVSKPCRYEPEINATFAELGRHYGCAIIPRAPASRATRRRSRGACCSFSGGSLPACGTSASTRSARSTGASASCSIASTRGPSRSARARAARPSTRSTARR
jgi:transposase